MQRKHELLSLEEVVHFVVVFVVQDLGLVDEIMILLIIILWIIPIQIPFDQLIDVLAIFNVEIFAF